MNAYHGGMATTQLQPKRASLTGADRCDRCGAQAYVATVMTTDGSELLWCAHHWRELGDAVKLVALDVHDETKKLAPAEGVQAG